MQPLDLKIIEGRGFTFQPRDWAMALLLGDARKASNANRASDADRGEDGNTAVDLHGALGELLLLRQATAREDGRAAEYMRHHMFSPKGGAGVKGPDLLLVEDGAEYGVDVKTFDCSPNKKYFAINARKHEQLADCCQAYIGLVVPRFGRKGILSVRIPYAEVSRWPASTLRPGGNPSRNLAFAEFARSYLPRGIDLEELRAVCHAQGEVHRAKAERGPDSAWVTLVELLPQVGAFLPP